MKSHKISHFLGTASSVGGMYSVIPYPCDNLPHFPLHHPKLTEDISTMGWPKENICKGNRSYEIRAVVLRSQMK